MYRMYKFWSLPKHYFNKVAKKSHRGKAKTDEFGRSARQRAFRYFSQGLRPWQLPDLGVPMTTIHRYFESWKHQGEDFQFRLAKKLLTSETASREKVARQLGVSGQALMEALKGSRSVAHENGTRDGDSSLPHARAGRGGDNGIHSPGRTSSYFGK